MHRLDALLTEQFRLFVLCKGHKRLSDGTKVQTSPLFHQHFHRGNHAVIQHCSEEIRDLQYEAVFSKVVGTWL